MAEFDKYAGEYKKLVHDPIRDWFGPGNSFFFERKWKLLAEHMTLAGLEPAACAWLDVGCGRGDLLRLGRTHLAQAVGCDVSTEMLADCTGLEVVPQTETNKLPFPDERFDLATAVCVYHHVAPAARPALTREIARVLRPGGMACIIEHNPFNPATQIIVRRLPVDADAHLLTWGTAGRLLKDAGLVQTHTKHFLFFPERLYHRASKIEAWLARVPAGGQYAVFGRKPASTT